MSSFPKAKFACELHLLLILLGVLENTDFYILHSKTE